MHSDMNNFYASVECSLKPELKNVPVAVCGDPKQRHGIVLAKNEIAKKLGVSTGDVIWQAKQKAPDLVVVEPHFDMYMSYSNKLFDLYNQFTDRVEPFGADECWLDCTGSTKLFGSGTSIADTIRSRVKEEFGLTCSVGVSFNKVFAKLASDMKKPDATILITKDNFKRKIYPMPVEDLIMVGRKTKVALNKLGVNTIGDLAVAPENVLKAHFGINGLKLKQYALGNDTEPVREAVAVRNAKSMGHSMTMPQDISSREQARDVLYYLAGRLAKRMRTNNVRGSLVYLSIRYSDLTWTGKQENMERPTYASDDIVRYALELFDMLWDGSPIRSMGVSMSKLVTTDSPIQLSLFDTPATDKMERIDDAIDKINAKFGNDCVCRASELGKDYIYDKNVSEDFLPFKR